MIHPTALIQDRVVIGKRVHIGAYSIIGDVEPRTEEAHRLIIEDHVFIGPMTRIQVGQFRDTVIGQGTKIAGQCLIAHDCIIGKRCIIHDCATIHGMVILGDNVILGVGARIRPRVIIEANSYIGMGAIVVSDVPSGVVYVGIPAKYLRKRDIKHLSWWNFRVKIKKLRKLVGESLGGKQ